MNDEELNAPVPIPVPVIIEKERFLRIAAKRTSRSPRKTPPLHVTPRTLLTGLCRCGYCQSPMHISTGKSGRYRYLKCNRRSSISRSICSSPNIPYERFEKLILNQIAEYVLTEKRLLTIFDDCRRHVDQLAKAQGPEREEITETKSKVERKLKNLYKLVEDEKVRIDETLKARITTWQDELEELSVKLDSLKVPISLPTNIVNNIDVSLFRAATLSVLENPDNDEAKNFLHLIVQEIRIYAEDATVTGSNLGLLEAALTHKRATAPTVPSFMLNWRRGRDSNPR